MMNDDRLTSAVMTRPSVSKLWLMLPACTHPPTHSTLTR